MIYIASANSLGNYKSSAQGSNDIYFDKPALLSVSALKEKINNVGLEGAELIELKGDVFNKLTDSRVKLARNKFFINVVELAISLAAFTISIGMSICSGGAATPVAVISGLNLLSSVSNLACAYHNWNCASKNKNELTMKNDAMQQAIFMLAKYSQISTEDAKKIARFTAFFIRVGIAVSLLSINVFINPMPDNSLILLVRKYLPPASSMFNLVTAGALDVWVNNYDDEINELCELLARIEQKIRDENYDHGKSKKNRGNEEVILI
ncbi:TPA: hypothetical protein ACQ301_000745 [Yersinia enterocolitica]